jgi:hypothetical protein
MSMFNGWHYFGRRSAFLIAAAARLIPSLKLAFETSV